MATHKLDAILKTKPSDNRATPKWLMEVFKGWFDPCPLNANPVVDGLAIEWEDKTFVNPPYSNPTEWVFKAIEESKKGKLIALLIRCDMTTRYGKALIDNNAHIFFCGERLYFVTPEGKSYRSPFPSILVILNP